MVLRAVKDLQDDAWRFASDLRNVVACNTTWFLHSLEQSNTWCAVCVQVLGVAGLEVMPCDSGHVTAAS